MAAAQVKLHEQRDRDRDEDEYQNAEQHVEARGRYGQTHNHEKIGGADMGSRFGIRLKR